MIASIIGNSLQAICWFAVKHCLSLLTSLIASVWLLLLQETVSDAFIG